MQLKKELKKEINNLLTLYPEPDNYSLLQIRLSGPIWKDNEVANNCLSIISKIKEYDVFNAHMQCVGNMASQVTYEYFLNWLLNRSRYTGLEKAFKEVDNYLSASNVELELVEVISGASSKHTYNFYNGCKFIGVNTIFNIENILSNVDFRKNLIDIAMSGFGTHALSGVISTKYFQKIKEYKTSDSNSIPDYKNEIPYQTLIDLRFCLSLSIKPENGIFSGGTTIVAPDSIPIINSGKSWSLSTPKQSNFGCEISLDEFKMADDLLMKLQAMTPKFKNKLMIPLDRLNNVGSRESLVDRAIELRICLESIFLNDGNKEQLRFRLSLRAALFLGDSLEERKRIFRIIKKAYDITSTAVHSGKVSNKAKEEKDLLMAIDLAKSALIKLIKIGEVNWENLELKF